MIENVLTRHFPAPEINRKEILRYSGAGKSEEYDSIIEDCLNDLSDSLHYSVCYREFPVVFGEDGFCSLGFTDIKSKGVSRLLEKSDRLVLFAATVGLAPDIYAKKYSKISPVKSLFAESIGDERVEALCGDFCTFFEKEYGVRLTPRFSPGYGDLPLDVQKDIFKYLNPGKHIGLTLSDSLIMTPVKSVTALAGIIR